jgi:hypothetical protein
MLLLPSDHPLGQPDVPVTGLLVKVSLDCCLKPARPLENHLLQIPDILEIQAIGQNPVDTYIAHHQHSQLAFTLGLRTHESGQKLGLLRVCFDNCHAVTPSAAKNQPLVQSMRMPRRNIRGGQTQSRGNLKKRAELDLFQDNCLDLVGPFSCQRVRALLL